MNILAEDCRIRRELARRPIEWEMVKDYLEEVAEFEQRKICKPVIEQLVEIGYGKWLLEFLKANYPTDKEVEEMEVAG